MTRGVLIMAALLAGCGAPVDAPLTLRADPPAAAIGEPIRFTLDGAGAVLAHVWYPGDGSQGITEAGAWCHTYGAAGVYEARAVRIDPDGRRASTTTWVAVVSPRMTITAQSPTPEAGMLNEQTERQTAFVDDGGAR